MKCSNVWVLVFLVIIRNLMCNYQWIDLQMCIFLLSWGFWSVEASFDWKSHWFAVIRVHNFVQCSSNVYKNGVDDIEYLLHFDRDSLWIVTQQNQWLYRMKKVKGEKTKTKNHIYFLLFRSFPYILSFNLWFIYFLVLLINLRMNVATFNDKPTEYFETRILN